VSAKVIELPLDGGAAVPPSQDGDEVGEVAVGEVASEVVDGLLR
jgi:hypothetical protein